MKIYFLKKEGKNWIGNFPHTINLEINGKEVYCAHLFFRKKDAKEYLKLYDSEGYNPFVVWSAEVKEDLRDNRKI
jgi:hypothetical protein